MAAEPRTEQQIIARFQEMRQAVENTWSKVLELESEASEHDLVIKTLEPMDPSRKCYRQIGDTLVERTVAETLPAVQRNKQNLEMAVKTLSEALEAKKKELSEFQAKYNIRTRGGGGGAEEDDDVPGASSKGGQKAAQGVLV